MTEWIITSSLLILVVLLVRRLFRGKLSLRVRYALWLVVLVRLLVPGTVAQTGLSVLNYLPRPGAEVSQATVIAPAPADGGGTVQANPAKPAGEGEAGPALPAAPAEPSGEGELIQTPSAAAHLPWRSVLKGVWLAGVLAVAAALAVSNLRFYLRLRRVRRPYPVPGVNLPVYVAPGLPSPCLYGFPRPAVYLTPAAAGDPAVLGHVLSHERTHFRHGDHIWAVLRGAALALHWYNPLVWYAAALSKRDGELACDEGALRGADNPTRAAYGRALLRLVTAKPAASDLFCCATTMTAGKSGLKERIAMLAKKPRTLVTALAAAAFLIGLGVGCTFTGGRSEAWEPLSDEELAFFNGDGFFNGDYLNIRNQFLSSTYETPEDINLFELFYCGDGTEQGELSPELSAAIGAEDAPCPATVLTTAQMDGVLEEYLGLTLAETNQVGLDNFTYLPEYDIYYYFHGDTNYRTSLTFQSGERNGNLVRLTYDDTFMADGIKQVTLREHGDGWRFVSNLAVAEGDVLPLESGLAALPDSLADRVVVTQDGSKGLHGSGPVACYYYAPEYENDTVRGGAMMDVVRYAPVDFEQSGLWGDSDVLLLGRDGDWYYVCHGPEGVFYSDDNMEDYISAYQELSAWLQELAADTGLTPMGEDLFYLRVSMNLSYQTGEHLSVAFRPDTGTSRAGTAEERVYTLVLSQPVTQGDTGIWCVDRWYDGDGEARVAVPRGTGGLTMDEYYASLQAACDAGDRRDLLDPVKAALDFMEGYFEADYSTLAFQVLGPTDIADTFDLYLATAEVEIDSPSDALMALFAGGDTPELLGHRIPGSGPWTTLLSQAELPDLQAWFSDCTWEAVDGYLPSEDTRENPPSGCHELLLSSVSDDYYGNIVLYWSDPYVLYQTAGDSRVWYCASGYDQLYARLAELWEIGVARGFPNQIYAEDWHLVSSGTPVDHLTFAQAADSLSWAPGEPAPAGAEGIALTNTGEFVTVTVYPGNLVYFDYLNTPWRFWFQGAGEADLYALAAEYAA